MDLVPIKVRIGLRPNGHADHPDWRELPLAATSDPASHMHHGWQYDKTSGHKEHTPDSPYGMQWGAVLVTLQFAEEAVVRFPETITRMTEAEFETFWDEKAHAHQPRERIDTDVLVGLKAERDLLMSLGRGTTEVESRISAALDSDNPVPGKRREHLKTWALAKVHLGVTIGNVA